MDLLLLFLFATTPVTYDKGCQPNKLACHNITWEVHRKDGEIISRIPKATSINYTKAEPTDKTQRHEIGHEFYLRIMELERNGDKEAEKELQIIRVMYDSSNLIDGDFLRRYSSESKFEDFADTFEFVVSGKELKTNSKILKIKVMFMKHLIEKYSERLDLIPGVNNI